MTGAHNYDVPAFEHIFRAMPSVDFYVQSLDDFTYTPEAAAQYDVALFYMMHRFQRGHEPLWTLQNAFAALDKLGQTAQGIVVLHHALLAFPDEPLWSEIVGLKDRSFNYHYGEPVTTHIAAAHPITAGLETWTMRDETYTMREPRPEDGNEILLTTDHPQSTKALGWTRQFGQSRVFCYQSGHDAGAFENPNYRRVLERAIGWTAGRL